MELPNDSALRQIDARFLGPKNMDLPWEARYVAYPVGFAILVVTLIVEHKIGVGINIPVVVLSLLIAIGLTTEIMRRVDAERPVRAIFQTFWHEIGTPRQVEGVSVELRVAKIRRKNGGL